MKTAVKHCVSSAYQIGTGGGVEGRRGLAPPPIRFRCSHPDISRGSFAAAAGKPLSFRVAGIRTVTVFIVSRRTV